jgi:hypothetical protein
MPFAGGVSHRLIAVAAIVLLAACGKSSPPAASLSGGGAVGYVRMDELVQKHPLYDQLARYDRSIEAFDLRATVPRVASNDPEMIARERDIEKQLSDAANRTKTLLDAKQKQYQQLEDGAIAAALQSAGSGPSAAQIAGAVNTTAAQQHSAVSAQAQNDYAAYGRALEAQDQTQIAAAQKALTERASRSWNAKAEELQSKEQALTLKLANDDAAQRLALRTKLTSLALDDAAREDAQKQLDAIDRKEADARAAEHNRDQQTLAVLQTQLHDQVQHDLNAQVEKIRARETAMMQKRQQTLGHQVSGAAPLIQTGTIAGPRSPQDLPPALRARIAQLHKDYQKRFQDDAKTTIADFQKTRLDLSRRYAELHGVDTSARRGGLSEVQTLRKKREELYNQITGQIDREVRLIAQQRGISVVLTDIVAPANGVDLTPDALKDIESLHE